ncbi:LysR family transcriptional regulator [Dongia mobilis]|uniref:LysR family transcriptional regulator n=1 Tax=Dongia mobilis TaxID=578943 RepID=A0A4R6WXH6_9PROT|nr:LysR family transcriptional regulator [Dongia mobilis]TDQ86378.1 LysR family transcriptional regulator [Dongia mobilis]
MDRLEAMALLVAVAEAGSLSAAARQLRAPLATVSRKVAELEAHLNARLLIRTNRQVQLTETGRDYLAAAREILGRVEEAERQAAGEYLTPRGELTVTAPIVFGRLHLLPVVAEFLQAFPEITLRLVLGDRLSNLIDDHIDAALRIGNLPDSNLVATRLGTTRRSAYASPDYLKRCGTPTKLADLIHHDCVSFENMTPSKFWMFHDGKRDMAVPVRTRLSVTTAEAAIDAAIAGTGITRVLSYQAAKAVAAGTLVPVLEAFEPPAWPIHFVHVAQGALPLKMRAFLDFATPRLRAKLA